MAGKEAGPCTGE